MKHPNYAEFVQPDEIEPAPVANKIFTALCTITTLLALYGLYSLIF